MKFEIIWSDFAETQLDDIYQYYKTIFINIIKRKQVKELQQNS
jgi:plasmid stabilization system protein ParE